MSWGYFLALRRRARSIAGHSIDPLAQEVCVPVVAGVLLDHVHVDPPQTDLPPSTQADADRIELQATSGRTTPVDHLVVRGYVRNGVGGVEGGEVTVGVVVAVVPRRGVLTAEHPEKPALLHLEHVPHQPEQAERRRRHGPSLQLLLPEPLAFI